MDIRVTPQGILSWNGRTHRCALGRAGVRLSKREGDGATPIGTFALRRVLYRSDRLDRPQTTLTVDTINPNDGWCDDPQDPMYNLPVTLPYAGHHEKLWRNDELYDLLIILGFNDEPPIRGIGSAIFLHVSRGELMPTEGCIALPLDTLSALLADCAQGDRLCVTSSEKNGVKS